jgi:hypothetical protein
MAKNNRLSGGISEIQCDQICIRKQEKQVNTPFIQIYFWSPFVLLLQINVVGALSDTKLFKRSFLLGT